MEMLLALYETPVVEQGGLRYKIQVRNYGGIWQQRHIWYPVEHSKPAWDGAVNRHSEGKWILTVPQQAPDKPYWRRIDNQRPQEERRMTPKHEDITVKLTGKDGNALRPAQPQDQQEE